MTNVNETADLEVTGAAIPTNLGAVPEAMKAQLKAVDPMNEIPCLVPNKPGFEAGKTLAGEYLRTNRIYSNKFTAGKVDAKGKYRDQHIFKDASGNIFGIWSVGSLGYVIPKIQAGTFVAITYLGLAKEALKEGQNVPHEFKYEGINGLDLSGQASTAN